MIAHQYNRLLRRVVGMRKVYPSLYRLAAASNICHETEAEHLRIRTTPGPASDEGGAGRDPSRVAAEFMNDVGKIGIVAAITDIKSCREEVRALMGELAELPTAASITAQFIQLIDDLEAKFEEFLISHEPLRLLKLIESGNKLYQAYLLTSTYSQAALEALTPPEESHPDRAYLTIYLPSQRDRLLDLVEKLSSIARLYEELAALIGVSAEEFPLEVSKIETGSFWGKFSGESKIIALFTELLKRVARVLTGESKTEEIARQMELIKSAVNLREVLKESGYDTGPMQSVIEEAALRTCQNINTLLSGSSAVVINEQTYGDHELTDRWLLPPPKVRRISSGSRTDGESRAETERAKHPPADEK